MNRRSISAPHPRARALTVKASTPEPANRGVTRSNATPAASVLRLCRRMALPVPATAARTRWTRSFVCNTHLLLCCPHRHPQHGSWLMGWLTMDTLRPRSDAKCGERSVVVKKTQLSQGQFRGDFWGATKTWRGCPRMWPQNRRGCKRAQLGQGQYGVPTLGKLR